MLFPSTSTAQQCVEFIRAQSTLGSQNQNSNGTVSSLHRVRAFDIILQKQSSPAGSFATASTMLSVVIYPDLYARYAKLFWQHSGEGVSSRRAEFFHKAFDEGLLMPRHLASEPQSPTQATSKGPRRYQKDPLPGASPTWTVKEPVSALNTQANVDYLQFIEERFGRNLDLSLTAQAKLAIRRRIAAPLTYDLDADSTVSMGSRHMLERGIKNLSEDHVFLYPTGMSAIYNSHRMLRRVRDTSLKSIMFGLVRNIILAFLIAYPLQLPVH